MKAKGVAWLIASNRWSPFYIRTQFAVVSNVSWGLLPWEADIIACSKTGFLTEIEIKVSLSDWKIDIQKQKFRDYEFTHRIKKFYYAAPIELAVRYQEVLMPPFAGVLGVSEYGGVKILKEAVTNNARKLSDKEMLQLARLGSMKAWKLTHEELQEESKCQPLVDPSLSETQSP